MQMLHIMLVNAHVCTESADYCLVTETNSDAYCMFTETKTADHSPGRVYPDTINAVLTRRHHVARFAR